MQAEKPSQAMDQQNWAKAIFFHRGADLRSACTCAIVSNFVLVRADFMLLSEGVIPRPSMHENFVDRQWECWLRENCPP